MLLYRVTFKIGTLVVHIYHRMEYTVLYEGGHSEWGGYIILRETCEHESSNSVSKSDSTGYSCEDLAGCDNLCSSYNSGASYDKA